VTKLDAITARLRARPDRPRRYRVVRCVSCHGMSWRRHWAGCVTCGKAFALETVERVIPDIKSNMGDVAA